MTSPPALRYDTYYHIFNRGINRENIFIEERNYAHFLSLYIQYIEPVAETYAYCLLKNHFHVLVRIRTELEIVQTLKVSLLGQQLIGRETHAGLGDIQGGKPLGSHFASQKFSNFFNAYAKAINAAYGRTGSLFQHPFGRVMIASDAHFCRVVAYIHQNPQKHRFVEDFRAWKYSSYDAIPSKAPTRLKRDAVLDWFGGEKGFIDLHAQWVTEEHSRAFAGEDFD